jgi:hypothetical protein
MLVQIMTVLGPIIVAVVYISLCSLFEEPNRQNINAIMIAGTCCTISTGIPSCRLNQPRRWDVLFATLRSVKNIARRCEQLS